MDATHYNVTRNTTLISPICSNIMQVESDMIIIYGAYLSLRKPPTNHNHNACKYRCLQ